MLYLSFNNNNVTPYGLGINGLFCDVVSFVV